MTKMSDNIRDIAANLDAISFGRGGIRISLTHAEPHAIAAYMMVCIGRGINTSETLRSMLERRGARLPHSIIRLILDVYDGRDKRSSLWYSDSAGEYRLLPD